MKKMKIFLFWALVLFLAPSTSRAQISITEIMYDLEGADSGREWLEVYNAGAEDVDFSAWRLFEADTNHKINAVASSTLPAGSFGVIAADPAKFSTDHADFVGLLFDSSFSLSNTGETLIIRDENLSDIDSVSYSPSIGGDGDGQSLQKSGSSWIAGSPTPAVGTGSDSTDGGNQASTTDSAISPNQPDTSSGAAASYEEMPSSHSSQSEVKVSFEPSALEVSAGRTRLGFVAVPLSFEAEVKSSKNIPLGNAVSSQWSMGDGAVKTGQFISHAYEFAGEYVVILNSQSGGASATAKIKVRIVEPRPIIVYADESYVEIYNPDKHELNLGGLTIETLGGRFVIPKDTIISPRSSVKLPSSVTKISILRNFISIKNPKGDMLISKPVLVTDLLVSLPPGVSLSEFEERLNSLKTR